MSTPDRLPMPVAAMVPHPANYSLPLQYWILVKQDLDGVWFQPTSPHFEATRELPTGSVHLVPLPTREQIDAILDDSCCRFHRADAILELLKGQTG